MAEYKSLFRVGFEVDDAVIDEIKAELYNNGVPSISKVGVGFSYLRSLPYSNHNGHCLSAKCIKNSIASLKFSQFDFNHDSEDIIGHIIGSRIFNDTDRLIPKTPLRLLGLGILYRNRLNDHYIKPQDLVDYATSFEIGFNDFDFWYKGEVILREDADSEWLLHLDDMVQGKAYYWQGERVCLILGGIDEDATVDFNANSLLTVEPGDEQAGILVAVAHKSNAIFEIEGGSEMTYTEEQLNEKIAVAKQEVEDSYTSKASELESKVSGLEGELGELKTKLGETETALASEKERAESAEAKLAEMESEKLVSERKQVLASKGYPEEMIDDEKEFLGKASTEEFEQFVTKFEALASKLKPAKTSTASATEPAKTVVANLTGSAGDDGKGNEDEVNDLSYLV
jgi:hypothetical protein